MAKVKTRKSRRINAERSLDLDLYAYVLEYLDALPVTDDTEARLRARDRFGLIALGALGCAPEQVKLRDGASLPTQQ